MRVLDSILTWVVDAIEAVYDYQLRVFGLRWGLAVFALTMLTIIAAVIGLFAVAVSKSSRGSVRKFAMSLTSLGRKTGGGLGRFIRWIAHTIWSGTRSVASLAVAITRSAIAAVLVLFGAIPAILAMAWFYPSLRSIIGPILILPIALLAGLLFWRAGRIGWAMLVLVSAALVFIGLAWFFHEPLGQGFLLVVIVSALIFFAAAREVRGKGFKWAAYAIGAIGFVFLAMFLVMTGATLLYVISPGLHQRAENYWNSQWLKSDRDSAAELAANSVDAYYNTLVVEKGKEIEQLKAAKAPEPVLKYAYEEFLRLKERADKAKADAKAAANPPAQQPAQTPAQASVAAKAEPQASAKPTCPHASQPAYPGDRQISLRLYHGKPFNLYWYSETCQRVKYDITGPVSTTQVTYVGHVWEAVDPDTNAVIWGPFRATDSISLDF